MCKARALLKPVIVFVSLQFAKVVTDIFTSAFLSPDKFLGKYSIVENEIAAQKVPKILRTRILAGGVSE